MAPFIGFLSSIAIFTPMLFFIYFGNYYNKNLLFNLLFMMCTCNIAFHEGFKLAYKKIKIVKFTDIDFSNSKIIIIGLFLIGFIATFTIRGVWMNTLDSGEKSNFIIAVNFANYLELTFLIALLYVSLKDNKNTWFIIIIILSSLILLETIVLLGRRNVSFRLLIYLLMAYSLLKPQKYVLIKKIILSFFVFGFIANSSIGAIRTYLSKNEETKISFLENFKNDFSKMDTKMGLDLGNAALGIDFVINKSDYDFGTSIWNKLVFLYVPRFIVGEEFKNSLMLNYQYEKYRKQITHGVTTMTGYFDAFAMFSYFGFIVFFIIGYYMGYLWILGKNSVFHLLLYFYLLAVTPNLFTHGVGQFIGKLSFIYLFFYPFFYYYKIKFKKVTKII
jgi:hypothetical protein